MAQREKDEPALDQEDEQLDEALSTATSPKTVADGEERHKRMAYIGTIAPLEPGRRLGSIRAAVQAVFGG